MRNTLNGRPAYTFVDSTDAKYQAGQPLTSLYQPIVVSNERYGELVAEGTSLYGDISIDVQSNLLVYTRGIESDDLTQSEIEKGYKVKIPLFGPIFAYPIIYMTLDIIELYTVGETEDTVQTEHTFEIYDDDYTIEGGNFLAIEEGLITPSLSSGQYGSRMEKMSAEWENSEEDSSTYQFYYRINTLIQTVIPYDEWVQTTPSFGQYGSRMEQMLGEWEDTEPPDAVQENGDRILDSTTNVRAKLVLAQTTSYLIADYFNVFNLASELAESSVEKDYTALVTAQSTLWSSIILLPLTVITAGSCAYINLAKAASMGVVGKIVAQAISGAWTRGALEAATKEASKVVSQLLIKSIIKTLVMYIASIPIQIITETFEELYIDPLIESLMLHWLIQSGTTRETAEFWALFVCSFREAFLGPASDALKGGLIGNLANKIAQIRDSTQATDINSVQEANQKIEATTKKHKRMETLSDFISADRIASIALSIPSFFIGGGGMASLTQVLDLSSDFLFDLELGKSKDSDESSSDAVLAEAKNKQHGLDIEIQNLIYQARTSSQIPVKPGPATKGLDPLLSKSEFDTLMYDVDQILFETEQQMKVFRRVENNLKSVEELKVNSESDSNENSFEIFVADVEQAAIQADPVYEINGMRIWIQPLPADRYNLKHEMTLNDFLDLIGIRNDPSKQAIYTNPLTGATYILNLFDGNMPLTEVLDLIGYDRNNLEEQFLGNANRIQVIDTTTILQLQDDTIALFHPDVSEGILYRHGVTDYQRSYFSKKVLDAFDIVKLRIQDTFRESIYESAYDIIKTKYSEDFGITQDEWIELVDSKAKDESGAFTQEFEKIVDLCLKEQVFLNLIELSGAQDQDVDAIFSTLDAYLDENFGSLIEQLFAPLTFEAFISEVIDQVLNNIDNDGFLNFNVPTQEYFDLIIQSEQTPNSFSLLYGDFGLINPNFNPNDPKWIGLINDARNFKNRQYALTSYLSEDKITELRILNNDLKIANSYKKPGDENVYLGLGRYDVQFYFDEIFIKSTDTGVYNRELDEYGFCSLINPYGQISLDNLRYDTSKATKQRFVNILEMLQSITIDDLSETSNDFDKFKFKEFIETKELLNNLESTVFIYGTNKYLLEYFDGDNVNFNSERDLQLAQEITRDCIKIFGRETFYKMLTGSVYKKGGNRLIFTEHSQDNFFDILNHLQMSLEYDPFTSQQKQITHIQNAYRSLMKFQPIKIELPTTNPSLEENNIRTIRIPGIPMENIMPLYLDPQSFTSVPHQTLNNYYNALTGDIMLEFSNIYRQLSPEGGSFLDDFVLHNHMTRLYIEEMNQLQAFGIIEGFNQYKIHGLEKTSFIRASEMSPDNPLLTTNPISRIYYLDKGYHKYDGRIITGGSGLEHDFQRHMYEQLEEWGIDDNEELAELILS
ncbi:MAG: hypothetical protein ACW98D_01635, partial [Promethearchaeota archaeon]